MSSLKLLDKKIIDDLFNQCGYVLNFSTDGFDKFTFESIRIQLCSKYNLSKGKSLMKFVAEGPDNLVGKLLSDLLEYYDVYYITDKTDQIILRKVEECKSIIHRLLKGCSSSVFQKQSEKISKAFNSQYIQNQINLMHDSIQDNPTEAIGKSKELSESCCITILESKNITVDSSWDLLRLIKETCKVLKLTPDDIPDTVKAAESIKQILRSLASITQGMAELRNPYGSGHGKSAKYKGLTSRHANLAVGSAVTLITFMWDTFEEQNQNN